MYDEIGKEEEIVMLRNIAKLSENGNASNITQSLLWTRIKWTIPLLVYVIYLR